MSFSANLDGNILQVERKFTFARIAYPCCVPEKLETSEVDDQANQAINESEKDSGKRRNDRPRATWADLAGLLLQAFPYAATVGLFVIAYLKDRENLRAAALVASAFLAVIATYQTVNSKSHRRGMLEMRSPLLLLALSLLLLGFGLGLLVKPSASPDDSGGPAVSGSTSPAGTTKLDHTPDESAGPSPGPTPTTTGPAPPSKPSASSSPSADLPRPTETPPTAAAPPSATVANASILNPENGANWASRKEVTGDARWVQDDDSIKLLVSSGASNRWESHDCIHEGKPDARQTFGCPLTLGEPANNRYYLRVVVVKHGETVSKYLEETPGQQPASDRRSVNW